ncbi:hypothetical protein AB1Y20_008694 [Prymnesium parvum]|uniref:KOW domain-containing protein n=1 Tax=Prymnesium parvum TaxID=97485 RepID=A0AB34IRV6_PRYPA|mmetsp:Transcript_7442/g.18503  ORF Transcript_7442/g.18503 Transcript_7442/m.18503 type:complete len:119 (-) Transcript_7442:283-639(-)
MLRLLICALCTIATASAFNLAVYSPPRSFCNVCMATGLKTGDMVTVISGADKGSVGKILSLDRKAGKVIVEGVNIRSKHVKPRKEGETGQILKREMPVHISNVAFDSEATDPVVEVNE